jgi:putative ABC transport system substrate-binding protein
MTSLRSRRDFLRSGIGIVTVGVLAGCDIRLAPTVRPARVGYLVAGTLESTASSLAAFRLGLSTLGYVEGQNVTLDVRTADGYEDRLPGLATELIRQPVNVLLTSGTAAIRAAMQATDAVPIVFANAADPVADGFVASLASPGGHVTGLTMAAGDESGKRMELLKHAVPSVSRVAVLSTPIVARYFAQTVTAAQALSVDVIPLEVNSPDGLNAVLNQAIAGRADGLNVLSSASLVPLSTAIVEFAASARLPAMYGTTSFATTGGLLTYSSSQAAGQVHPSIVLIAEHVSDVLAGHESAQRALERVGGGQPSRLRRPVWHE